ncbi:hypothetical protein SLA2020_247850 [Shorea laevis]
MNGASKAAKHPNALLAFSIGPRACIGQNFAMLEVKNCACLDSPKVFFHLLPRVQTCSYRQPFFTGSTRPPCSLQTSEHERLDFCEYH